MATTNHGGRYLVHGVWVDAAGNRIDSPAVVAPSSTDPTPEPKRRTRKAGA